MQEYVNGYRSDGLVDADWPGSKEHQPFRLTANG